MLTFTLGDFSAFHRLNALLVAFSRIHYDILVAYKYHRVDFNLLRNIIASRRCPSRAKISANTVQLLQCAQNTVGIRRRHTVAKNDTLGLPIQGSLWTSTDTGSFGPYQNRKMYLCLPSLFDDGIYLSPQSAKWQSFNWVLIYWAKSAFKMVVVRDGRKGKLQPLHTLSSTSSTAGVALETLKHYQGSLVAQTQQLQAYLKPPSKHQPTWLSISEVNPRILT